MSTTRLHVPAARMRAWIERIAEWRAAQAARVERARSLPDLLERLGTRHAPAARRRDIYLDLDIDAALAPDLVGPFAALGEVLGLLMTHAITHAVGHVALRVDVVGDAPGVQTVHFTVSHVDAVPSDEEPAAWRTAQHAVVALGGTWHVECDDDVRAIVELPFTVPPQPPQVDVAALRVTMGGDAALREVVNALDVALTDDLGHLDGMLADNNAHAVQQWLHRVSGALGMAEATGLAATGIRLEREVAGRPLAEVATEVRRFAVDAHAALAWLRAAASGDPL